MSNNAHVLCSFNISRVSVNLLNAQFENCELKKEKNGNAFHFENLIKAFTHT